MYAGSEVEHQYATPLQSVSERAKGVVYRERMEPIAEWRPPRKYRDKPEDARNKDREKYYIDVGGPPEHKMPNWDGFVTTAWLEIVCVAVFHVFHQSAEQACSNCGLAQRSVGRGVASGGRAER